MHSSKLIYTQQLSKVENTLCFRSVNLRPYSAKILGLGPSALRIHARLQTGHNYSRRLGVIRGVVGESERELKKGARI